MSTMLPLRVPLSLIKSPSVIILKLAALIVVPLLLINVFAVISRLLVSRISVSSVSRISVLLLLKNSPPTISFAFQTKLPAESL